MVNGSTYVDTNAFAKLCLNEARSDEVEAFIRARRSIAISRLTAIELRCQLARRRRNKEIDRRIKRVVLETFDGDMRQGLVEVHPLEDRHAVAAYGLLTRLARHPLRTLDALYLAIALESDARVLATADAVMGAAATTLGMTVERFDQAKNFGAASFASYYDPCVCLTLRTGSDPMPRDCNPDVPRIGTARMRRDARALILNHPRTPV